jgi:diguanylate cyclase (GGDEF)-like protein
VRLGGDEFAVMIPNITRRDDLDVLSMRLGRALDFPLEFDNGAHVRVTASIGIALFPEDASTVDELLAAADSEMYKEKRRYYNVASDRGATLEHHAPS